MNKKQRLNSIRVFLLKYKKAYVSDLALLFEVSQRTIRRDLIDLVNNGIASVFFGGATLTNISNKDAFNNIGVLNIMSNMTINNKKNIVNKFNTKSSPISSQNEIYILGSFNIDIVSEVDIFPKIGQTIRSISTNFYAGGKGSNQAIAAAKVSDRVHFTVKVGQDEFGSKAKKYLSSTNIHSFSIFESDKKPTGNAVILVEKNSGENMITIDLAANETLTSAELMTDLSFINNSNVFLTQLENNFDITKLAIEYAKRSETIVMLNPAPYTVKIKDIIHLVDIITPNITEAESLSGVLITDDLSAELAAKTIYGMGAKIVIITLGSQGALLYDGKRTKKFAPFKAAVIDSSGAGDAFNGSLAAMLAKGQPIDYSIQYASAFASLAVELNGASSMPNVEFVEARLNSMNTML